MSFDLFIQDQPAASANRKALSIGRDELSLIELAFTPVGTRDQRDEISTEWVGTDAAGKRKRFYKEVTASKYGLPGYLAEEVLIALLWVAGRNGFQDTTIQTNPTELLRIMGRSQSGKDYDNLQAALDQLTSVYIKTNALWDNETQSYVESGFHIVNQYKLATEKGRSNKKLTVSWNKDLFRVFRRQRFKPIDVSFYYSLGRATSKRLFRWLDKHLRRSGRAEIDVLHLAHVKLEMSPNKKYVSQVMQTLEPACNELADRGYCTWSKQESQTGSGYKLVFERSDKPDPQLEEQSQAIREELKEKLTERGITANVVEKLTREHAEEVITKQIRHYDFLRAQHNTPRSPGWLREAIEKDFGLPNELEEKRRRKAMSARRQQRENETATHEQARASERTEAFEEAFADLTAEEQEELREGAIDMLDDFNRKLYDQSNGSSLPARVMIKHNMMDLLLGSVDDGT